MQIELFYNLLTRCEFKFTTDSRNIPKGGIFFALKGDHFNGNEFALQAIESGASYAVVDEIIQENDQLILVNDVLTFLQELSHFHRNCFDIPVLAVAGSNGKTTTKNIIETILKQRYKTHCTKGNFNNHIGVPITLLSIPIDCEIAIIELGTNNPGEIAELSQLVAPTHGIITNIGKEHLEGFGTLEAVAKEESELFHYLLKNDGIVFVNEDDEWLKRMSRAIQRKQYYSKNNIEIKALVPSICFDYQNIEITSPLMGDYNLDNILSSIAIGEHFKVPLNDIQQGILSYQPDNNRSQWIELNSNDILLDAYNANPSSMKAAIKNFDLLPHKNKIIILGDMFEMGNAAQKEHEELLQFAITFDFDTIYLLGDNFKKISENQDIYTCDNIQELGKKIKAKNYKNTAILVKGSRGMKMELVLDFI